MNNRSDTDASRHGDIDPASISPLVLVGCGKMGSALLYGWTS